MNKSTLTTMYNRGSAQPGGIARAWEKHQTRAAEKADTARVTYLLLRPAGPCKTTAHTARVTYIDALRLAFERAHTARVTYPMMLSTIDIDGSGCPEHDGSRKTNWQAPRPSCELHSRTPEAYSVDLGQYSSRCKYTHYEHYMSVRCCAIHSERNGIAYIGELHLPIRAPHGYKFVSIDGALAIVNRAGDDYHLSAHDIRTLTPSGWARKLRQNAAIRRASKPGKISQTVRGIPVVCTVTDARAAGNCAAGIYSWRDKSGLRGKSVAARVLLRLAARETEYYRDRIVRSVAVACQRYRADFARGYSDVQQ